MICQPAIHQPQVKFAHPVQIHSITITSTNIAVPGQQIFRGWAKDLFSVTSARFVPLFGNLVVPQQQVPVIEVRGEKSL